jgi:hypothetical protein
MWILESLKRSGVPPLDPRIARIAYDDAMTIEVRQVMLDDLYLELSDEHNRAHISGEQAALEMRRRAREFQE